MVAGLTRNQFISQQRQIQKLMEKEPGPPL